VKRLLAPAGVLLIALTACGAGAASAPQATGPHAGRAGHVRAVAAARKRVAEGRARELLGAFTPPPHATRLRSFSAADGPLSYSGLGTPGDGELAARHGFWQVRMPLASALAFVKRHPVPGLKLGSEAKVPGAQPNEALGYNSHTRLLTVTLVRLHERTVIRVDAGAVWIYPRSPKEVVPAGVSTIDIRARRVTKHVAGPERVAEIVHRLNALEIVQPGVHVICPLVLFAPAVTFDFRSASGALLAQAIVPGGPSSSCNPLRFSIGGHEQTPLLGDRFLQRVERLLGAQFAPVARP
jgi:hypothetical protein